jgi:chromosome segregation ATPase
VIEKEKAMLDFLWSLPWWILLALAFIFGFIVEWLLEVLWWRRSVWGNDNYQLQTELTAARHEVQLLRSGGEFQGLRADLDVANKARFDLEGNLKRSGLELSDAKGRLATLQAEFDKLRGDHSLKLGEIATLTAGAAAAAAAIKAKDAEIGKVRASMPDLGKINADWEAKLKARDVELGDLRAELGKLKGDHSLKLGEIATLTAGAAAAAAAIKAKDDEMGRLKLRLGELEASLKTKDADLGNWNMRFNTLKADFDKAATGRVDFEAMLKAREKELADANVRFANLQADFGKSNADKAKLQLTITDLQKEVADLRVRIGVLEGDAAKLKGDHSLKLGEIATLTAGAAAAGAVIKGKDDELGKLRVQIGNLENQIKLRDADLGALNTRFAALQGELNTAKSGSGKLDTDLKAALAARADLDAKLKAREAEVAKLTADWNAKLKAQDDEVARLRTETEKNKGDHGRTVAEIATLTAGAAAAAAAIKAKDDELGRLRVRITDLEGAAKAKDADWAAKLKAKDDELANWNVRFDSLRGDYDKFQITAKGNDAELANLRARLNLLQADLDKLNYTRGTLEASLKARDGHVADLQAEIAKLREAETAKANQLATFSASAAAAASAIQGREKDLADANARYATLDKSFNDAKWRIGELEAELAKLRGAQGDYETRVAGLDKNFNDAKWRIGELEAELAALRGEKGEIEAQLQELKSRPAPSAPTPAAPQVATFAAKGFADEAAAKAGIAVVRSECPQHLSEINGIGTVFEQRLFEFGIGTYWEVASLSDDDFRKALKLDEIAKASKSGGRMLNIDMNAIRMDALRMAKETDTQGRTWLGGHPDDFEPIDGIGHVFELRLYDAGICTYEALLKTDVQRLAEICKPPKRFKTPDYEGWKAQAAKLLAKQRKSAKG